MQLRILPGGKHLGHPYALWFIALPLMMLALSILPILRKYTRWKRKFHIEQLNFVNIDAKDNNDGDDGEDIGLSNDIEDLKSEEVEYNENEEPEYGFCYSRESTLPLVDGYSKESHG
ncbi:uncharacterized protein [Periplaneta americana]|uniref:uncharacterized protein isoform X3 n=1 Tax=Periplaneta americana TaxID=6978 RepID=UPI0037E82F0D